MENVQYATWAELFKVHARSHHVLHHIIPPKDATVTTPSTEDSELWMTLDATVLQWIYSTISTDLLHKIIEPDAPAMDAWNHLQDIFQDNKNSRVVALEQEFSHLSMEDFSNASAYCQRLKEIFDQLKNVASVLRFQMIDLYYNWFPALLPPITRLILLFVKFLLFLLSTKQDQYLLWRRPDLPNKLPPVPSLLWWLSLHMIRMSLLHTSHNSIIMGEKDSKSQ